MKKINILLNGLLLGMASACTPKEATEITITPEVINADYIGNGAEWDPYDEAESWGASVSDKDWETLYKRLDFMKPQYVRCMINSPYRYYDLETGKYDKTRNIESISRLLEYCTERGITVVYGEYNPPTWDMKEDQKWVDMSVDYLNYLVNDLGFSCIKHFIIFNEPDGNWASTNGDYEMWKNMLFRFQSKMEEYPRLTEKVTLAGPDVVADYRNKASNHDAEGWVKQSVLDADSIIGIYDVHSYPGQNEVRNGKYPEILARYKQHLPEGKKIVLGEAGYKYWRKADSLLMAEYNRRVEGHPFTKGSDCNMLCYDYFYGLDMPLLAMQVMNTGYSGMAVWMLDDAMHSCGDSGKTEDVKIWGFWNTLGEEVFHNAQEEEIRPWFYTWSLMCRYFPTGTDILHSSVASTEQDVYVTAGTYKGKLTIALVNVGEKDKNIRITLPQPMDNASLYVYEENNLAKDSDGFPIPSKNGLKLTNNYETTLKAQTFQLLTDIKY